MRGGAVAADTAEFWSEVRPQRTFRPCPLPLPNQNALAAQVECFAGFMRYVGAKHHLGLVQAFEPQLAPEGGEYATQNYYCSEYTQY